MSDSKEKGFNLYTDAKQLMKELFDIGYLLKGTGVDTKPLTDIMEHCYSNYILPVEWEQAQEKENEERLHSRPEDLDEDAHRRRLAVT